MSLVLLVIGIFLILMAAKSCYKTSKLIIDQYGYFDIQIAIHGSIEMPDPLNKGSVLSIKLSDMYITQTIFLIIGIVIIIFAL